MNDASGRYTWEKQLLPGDTGYPEWKQRQIEKGFLPDKVDELAYAIDRGDIHTVRKIIDESNLRKEKKYEH